MRNKLLYVRQRQLVREINGLGLYVIIIAAIICLFIFLCLKTYQKSPNSYYLTSALFTLCLTLQFYRKDKTFISSHITNWHKEMFLEYVALTFLFSVSSLFTKNWMCFPILLVLLFCIPWLKFTKKERTYFKNISSIIPAKNFEWISGFRKTYLSSIPLYMLAIGFCWFRVLPIFLLWLITITISSFYSECEPINILRAEAKNENEFLCKKIKHHTSFVLILYLPIVLVNALFNADYWLICVLFLSMQIVVICFSICLKYSNYAPNKSSIGNNIILSFILLLSVVPYFLPIPLAMCFYFFWKAKSNLKIYFND